MKICRSVVLSLLMVLSIFPCCWCKRSWVSDELKIIDSLNTLLWIVLTTFWNFVFNTHPKKEENPFSIVVSEIQQQRSEEKSMWRRRRWVHGKKLMNGFVTKNQEVGNYGLSKKVLSTVSAKKNVGADDVHTLPYWMSFLHNVFVNVYTLLLNVYKLSQCF